MSRQSLNSLFVSVTTTKELGVRNRNLSDATTIDQEQQASGVINAARAVTTFV
jgi:hypothetical protein